jgi:DNA repair exonuclease SbcCD ATPase subunit
MRNRRNNTRDGVMGIGAESYDNHTETPSKPETTTERLETQMPPSAHEEDDSEPEVVVISSSVISKRKLSIASTPGPRNKRAKTARALSDEPRLPDSESEGDSGEDESKYDDEEGAVDPKHQEKSAAASKEFNSACRTCKSNANKALKAKYDLEISKLKSEHKQELRELKADKAKILADTKKKAKKEMAMLKTKYEGLFEELKRHRDEKLEAWKDKHKKTTEEWQEKFDEEKKKVKKLTTQRDTAEAKRKEIERSAADDIKAAKEDLKAGERKLKEEKKQFMREKQDEIDLLKPQHSKALKEQDTIIKDMTQKVLTLEKDVQTGERTRDRIRNSHDIVLQRYQQLKTEHAEAQKHTKQVEKDLNDTKKYIAGVDGRADLRLVRAEEKLGIQETNVREHANRVITLQRENYNLKDSVDQLAKLGREKRDEIERLKTELQSTKAELGVVKDMEEMSGGFE